MKNRPTFSEWATARDVARIVLVVAARQNVVVSELNVEGADAFLRYCDLEYNDRKRLSTLPNTVDKGLIDIVCRIAGTTMREQRESRITEMLNDTSERREKARREFNFMFGE